MDTFTAFFGMALALTLFLWSVLFLVLDDTVLENALSPVLTLLLYPASIGMFYISLIRFLELQ
jgi:hypothetical protein